MEGLIGLVIVVLVIAGMWKTFDKAGQPGWAAIIPIFNIYIALQVAGKPGWWLILMLIPVVNVVINLLMSLAIAENFGKSALFGIGLFFLGPIFYMILDFGDAQYGGA